MEDIGFKRVLPRVMRGTVLISPVDRSAALIVGIPASPLVLVDPLAVKVHLLPTVSTDDFTLEQVDERCSDFIGLLHTRLPSLRSRLDDVLHLLEVLTGDNCLMGVREHNPLVLILDIMGLDALVDCLHGAAKDGIAHIMRIGQDAVQR